MTGRGNSKRHDGQPYVRIHNGHWHLFYRNPDPSKQYPAHRSLRLRPEQVQEAETVEAEARLVWKQCEGELNVDPSATGKVFARFVQEKVEGRQTQAATAAESPYLARNLGELLEEFLASKEGKAKRTRRTYRTHVGNLRRLMDCGQPVAEITPEHVPAIPSSSRGP